MKLDRKDLDRINDLWETVINPACIKFGEDTGKPAELFQEGLAGVFERRVSTTHRWNAWQRVWWGRFGKIEDDGLLGASISAILLRSS